MSKSDTTLIDWSPANAALAALVLACAIGKADEANVAHYIATIPAFKDTPTARLDMLIMIVRDMASAEDGFDIVLELISAATPENNAATIYALTADYIAAYGAAAPEEMRFLECLGASLKLDRLTRAALDLAAQVRAQDLA